MADNILRLRVDSQEYDAKLKKAAEGIRHLAEVAHKGGGELTGLEKAELDYVKGLGTMETKSRTAAGGVRELESVFKELTVVYNHLNDVEKEDEGGKALRASLEQIKQRAQEARTELEAASKSLQGVESGMNSANDGSLLSKLGGKMDGALAVFGGNLMTKAAGMGVGLVTEMTDAVKQGIELAKAGEGVRIAFERLGRGDILQGLREATHGTVTDLELMKAAVKFNDFKLPVEELGTMLAFAQQKAKDTGQSVDYMVDSIVTGLGRKSLMILDNLGLSATEIRERMKETGDMTKAVGAIIREQMASAGDYVETAADRAAQATVAQQNKMEELGRKIMPLAEESAAMWNSIKIGGLSVIANVLDPMISKFTHLGRLMAAQGMSSNGGGGSMNRMIGMLGTGQGDNARSTYNRQVAAFNRSISARRADVTAVERWQRGERSQELKGTMNRLRDMYGADFQRVVRDNLNATINNLNEYKKRAQQLMSSGAVPAPASDTTPTGTTGGTRSASSPARQQTEMQQNQTRINELTQQYVSLMAAASEAGKPLTDEQQKQTSEIQRQISELEKRNGLLSLYQEQAQGRLLGVDPKTGGLSMTGGFTGFATPSSMSDVVRQRGGNLLDDKAMKAVNEDISRNLPKDNETDKRDDPLKEAKKQNQYLEGIGSDISGMLSGLEKMGIEIPEGLSSVVGGIQMISGIVSSILTLVGVISALTSVKSVPIFGWLLAQGGIAGGLGGRHPIHAAGGTVVGNTYSGDQIPAMLNAGEVVLNRAQQGNIASQLENGASQNLKLDAVITGEQIRMVLNNNGRRTGRGEYVTSNRR